MCWAANGLHEVERLYNLGKPPGVSIGRVINVNVEVTAHDDRTAIRGNDLEQTNQFLEEQFRRVDATWSIDDNVHSRCCG